MSTSKLNIDHLSVNECERILGVLQRDYDLRHRERTRLRPEEVIPLSTSRPPKPPRQHQQHERSLYSSQQLSSPTSSASQPYSLQESLNQFTSAKPMNLSEQLAGSRSRLDISDSLQKRHKNIHPHSFYGSYDTLTDLGKDSEQFISNGVSRRESMQYCSECGDSLSPLAKRKAQCLICKQWICKPCAMWEPKHEGYICERHDEEEGYSEYNRHSSDWTYDNENKKFVRTNKGQVSADINRKLHKNGVHSVALGLEEIPLLSLEAFEQSMQGLLSNPRAQTGTQDAENEMDSSDDGYSTNRYSVHQSTSTSNLLSMEDFFQSKAQAGDNVLITDKFQAELDLVLTEKFNGGEEDDPLNETDFQTAKEIETKRFLMDINRSVTKIRDCLANNDSESQVDEMLTYHRSVISALVANLEQSLHLAVDSQSSSDKFSPLVKHTQVASVVISIVEEYSGLSLSDSSMAAEGALDFGEIADCILAQVLEEEEEAKDYTDNGNNSPKSAGESKVSLSSSTDDSYSDYGSYKFPSLSSKASEELDPDLLSLGQTSSNIIPEELEDDLQSQDSSQWDAESIISATSSNWLFKGRPLAYDSTSISGKSSLFNAHSTSEESLNVMFVPNPTSKDDSDRHGGGLSDDGSEHTLTISSDDSLSVEALEITPRSAFDDDMIRTELRRTNSQGVNGEKSGYVSVSRNTVTSPTRSESKTNEYSEIGEESKDLKFTTKPKSQTVCTGDVAKITCTVEGASPIDVYWFKEGVDDTDALETNEKYEVTSEDDKHTLEVFFTTPEDNGQYLCLAKNDFTSSHWLFGLTVEESSSYEQKPPLFLKELYDMEVAEGDTVKLRCKVRAYPPPRVTWLKDGQRIDNSYCYKLEKFGNRDYVLTISPVTPDHDAEFTVVARNGAGEAKSSAQLVVEAFDHEEGVCVGRRDHPKHSGSKDINARRPSLADRRRPLSPIQINTADISTSSIVNSRMSLTMEPEEKTTPTTKTSLTANNSDSGKPSQQKIAKLELSPQKVEKKRPISVQEKTIVASVKDSMRASWGDEKNIDPMGHSEAENTVKVSMTPLLRSERPVTERTAGEHFSKPDRHSSVVELLKVTPIKPDPHSATPPEPISSTPVSETTGAASPTADSPSTWSPRLRSTSQIEREETEHNGVDIQPGFVRERQFQEFGDKITPVKSTKKHKKSAAPLPPAKSPEVIELRGSSELEDLPSSRGEWSGFFPSIKQRRESYSSEASPDVLNSQETVTKVENIRDECNNNETKPEQSVTKKKGPAPQPPTTNTNNVEPGKRRKTVRKVVQRTVSVKKTVLPADMSSFQDGRPDDSADYIKICGKWVKMKQRVNKPQSLPSSTKATKMSSDEAEISIPISRSEWGGNLPVGRHMKEFKRAQEANGSVITGRCFEENYPSENV